jgi:restriction system protein
MARRKKSSLAEDVIAVIALMPWWAGALLAIVSYFWLHGIAVRPVMVAPASASLPLQSVWKGLASAGQYILPLLCIAGAGVSFWQRRQRNRLVTTVVQSDANDVLHGMNWRDFEVLVAEGFRLQGYRAEETGGGGPDGGIDLVLSRPGSNGREKFLVQCKQWRAFKVGVDVVRELYGVMASRGAAGGFVVTSGRFTDEAVRFANGTNVTLVDGPKLHKLIQQARAARPPSADTDASPAPRSAPEPTRKPAASTAPDCPVCNKPMTRRTAQRGANAGRAFWGCTGYPACRGTRPID